MSDASEIKQGILHIAASISGLAADSIDLTGSLEDSQLDSLDMVSIVYEIENRYEIELPEADIQSLETFEALVALVKSRVDAKSL